MPSIAMLGATGPKFNTATGGTETTVTNYNGTGQTWRVHTFTSNGAFTISRSVQPFRVLVAGGGGGGGGSNGVAGGGGGGGGQVLANDTESLGVGAHTVTIGGGGAGGFDRSVGSNGGTTSLGSLSRGGGSGGCETCGGGTGGSPAGPVSGGTSSTITGSNTTYAQNGGFGGDQVGGPQGAGFGGGGGGAPAGLAQQSGNAGTSGVVIVAYRIA